MEKGARGPLISWLESKLCHTTQSVGRINKGGHDFQGP